MFKYYTTFDIISEFNVQILRSKHSIQIFLDNNDLFLLANSFLELLNENIEVELIIISPNNSKSLKTINLLKRLIDGGFVIYWKTHTDAFTRTSSFGIFDKTLLITEPDSKLTNQNDVEIVRDKNSYFKSILLESEKVNLLTGNINVSFKANKTIIYKNESITLSWNVENAYHASLTPNIGDINLVGSTTLKLDNDRTFTLKAINKEISTTKIVFVKVLENNNINLNISVFDKSLNQYIKIEPSLNNKGHYGVFLGQSLKISWDINMPGKFHEDSLGVLPLSGSHEEVIKENTRFSFTFKTVCKTQIERVSVHPFHEDFTKKMESKSKKSMGERGTKHFNIISRLSLIFNKLKFDVFNKNK